MNCSWLQSIFLSVQAANFGLTITLEIPHEFPVPYIDLKWCSESSKSSLKLEMNKYPRGAVYVLSNYRKYTDGQVVKSFQDLQQEFLRQLAYLQQINGTEYRTKLSWDDLLKIEPVLEPSHMSRKLERNQNDPPNSFGEFEFFKFS